MHNSVSPNELRRVDGVKPDIQLDSTQVLRGPQKCRSRTARCESFDPAHTVTQQKMGRKNCYKKELKTPTAQLEEGDINLT